MSPVLPDVRRLRPYCDADSFTLHKHMYNGERMGLVRDFIITKLCVWGLVPEELVVDGTKGEWGDDFDVAIAKLKAMPDALRKKLMVNELLADFVAICPEWVFPSEVEYDGEPGRNFDAAIAWIRQLDKCMMFAKAAVMETAFWEEIQNRLATMKARAIG